MITSIVSTRLRQFILHTITNLAVITLKKCFQFDGWNIVLFRLHWLVKLNVFSCIYWPFVFLIVWFGNNTLCSFFLLCFHFLLVIGRRLFYFLLFILSAFTHMIDILSSLVCLIIFKILKLNIVDTKQYIWNVFNLQRMTIE